MTTTDKPLPDLLRELDELHEKATPGPWACDGECISGATAVHTNYGYVVSSGCEGDGGVEPGDRDFIVALRNAWPRLRDEIERAARHNCEAWQNDGIGCAECNPTASAIREYWDDPIRRERDALKAENGALRSVIAVVDTASYHGWGGFRNESSDFHDEIDAALAKWKGLQMRKEMGRG